MRGDKRKVKRFFLGMLLALLLLAIVFTGAVTVLVYAGFEDLPVVSGIAEQLRGFLGQEEEPVYKGAAVGSGYRPREENIVYENETKSFGYVNNMILIFFRKQTSEERIREIVESVDGEIVGTIEGLGQYQVQVEPRDKSELEELCRKLAEFEEVSGAIVDTVVAMEKEASWIPDDPWKEGWDGWTGVDWNEEKPGGTNWWMEAVKVLSAWESEEYFSEISVGVVDNGFDTEHEDLSIKVLNEDVNNVEAHGTHVAGVIGAGINNGKGISGILKKGTVYGVDCYATEEQKEEAVAVSNLMEGIVFCLEENCRVVNMSSGKIWQPEEEMQQIVHDSCYSTTMYLLTMKSFCEQDFLIVQSAGNGDNQGNGVDSAGFNGFFTSLNEESVQQAFQELKEDGMMEEELEQYTVQDILDSCMVVGAVDKKKKKGQYQLAQFSNYGDALTVCAPGVKIFSTLPTGGSKGSYGYMQGTSMAAPIVAGITAMTWSVDQEMTAGEVKQLIIDTATEEVLSRQEADTGTYYMINAQAAVEKAVEKVKEKKAAAEGTSVSEEREVVLVLDVSGSMSGTPMEETKKASENFIETVLAEDAGIALVTYSGQAECVSEFSREEELLRDAVKELQANGGTNMEDGLAQADGMLANSRARKKIIVLMSDGLPNRGKEGDELTAYAAELKEKGILIYTLGFFENLTGEKADAQQLMEEIASDGCHYEVASADELKFFFEDMADQINGQKYIYIRIACPVEVSVSYGGETLWSGKRRQNLRTDFGTLTFEEQKKMFNGILKDRIGETAEQVDQVKILRLKEEAAYDIQIVGTGKGSMDYTIAFMDEDGEYTDYRKFKNIPITEDTVIDTVAAVSTESVLKVDEDGDGRLDRKYRAGSNEDGEEVPVIPWIPIGCAGGAVLLLLLILAGIRGALKRRSAGQR